MPEQNIAVIEAENLSSQYDKRYIVIDKDTGQVLDDAQGYGYRSVQKAYAAYGYKTRDKSKDAEKRARKRHIQKWLREHKDFDEQMEIAAWDSAKGCEPFNAALVKGMLKANNLNPDFTAGELLRVWNSQRE